MVMSEFKSSNFACEKCRRMFCKGCVNTIKYVPVICSLFLCYSKKVSPVPPVNKVLENSIKAFQHQSWGNEMIIYYCLKILLIKEVSKAKLF